MALVNNTQVNTSIGQNLTGTFAVVDYNTNSLVNGEGTVYATLSWYKSESDYDSSVNKALAKVYPMDNGVIVQEVSFQVALTDVVKASGECTFQDVFIFFNTKVKNTLNASYGWDIQLS